MRSRALISARGRDRAGVGELGALAESPGGPVKGLDMDAVELTSLSRWCTGWRRTRPPPPAGPARWSRPCGGPSKPWPGCARLADQWAVPQVPGRGVWVLWLSFLFTIQSALRHAAARAAKRPIPARSRARASPARAVTAEAPGYANSGSKCINALICTNSAELDGQTAQQAKGMAVVPDAQSSCHRRRTMRAFPR